MPTHLLHPSDYAAQKALTVGTDRIAILDSQAADAPKGSTIAGIAGILAANVVNAPSGSMTEVTVQAAINALQTAIDGLESINASNFEAGAADPVGGDGVDGDFWMNVTSGDVFGPKASGTWPGTPLGNAYTQLGLSNATPAALGSASAGVATAASRADHVHPIPDAADIPYDPTGDAIIQAGDVTVDAALARLDSAIDNLTDYYFTSGEAMPAAGANVAINMGTFQATFNNADRFTVNQVNGSILQMHPAASGWTSTNGTLTFTAPTQVNLVANAAGGEINLNAGTGGVVIGTGRNLAFKNTAGSQRVNLKAPTALAATYSMEWFDALPGSQSMVTLNASGKFQTAAIPSGVSPADAVSPEANDNTGAVGTETQYAREDHKHPAQTLAATTASGNTTADDIEITDATKGTIHKSPNGTRWRLTVNNDGAVIMTSL